MPETVVMKFGGTSVADAERIQRAAARIVQRAEQGNHVVAVLSARGKHTDELVALAHEVSPRPHPREMDMLLSTGERVSCALAAMVINDLGHQAISLTGSQAGIVTDSGHTKARILEIKAHRIREALDEADKARQEARELREITRREREEAKGDRERILEESRLQAQRQLDQARKRADEDLKERLEKNREELDAENARLREQIRRDVVELTLLAAEKVTGKVLTEEDQRRLVDETVAEVDVKRLASEN